MAALDELSPLIEPLLAATGAPTTARTPWLRAWARCHPAHHPWVVCVYDADDLVGAALLSVRRSLGLRHVVALGHHDSDHARFPVLNQHAAEALARAIVVGLRDLGPAWSLHLEQFPADDPVLHHLAALLSCAEIEPGAPLPVLAIPPDLPAEKYASKKFRQQTRAARRRFEEEGLTVELRYERQHERIEALLPEIREIRRSRDHDRGRKSGLDGSVGENWWRHVTLDLAARGEMEAVTLHAGDEIVAYSLGLLDGDTYRLWDGRFDPRFRLQWPGQLLYGELLQHLVAAGTWRQVDFMRGRTIFKDRIAHEAAPSDDLRAYSSAALRRASLAGAHALRSAREWKGHSPTFAAGYEALKRRALARFYPRADVDAEDTRDEPTSR